MAGRDRWCDACYSRGRRLPGPQGPPLGRSASRATRKGRCQTSQLRDVTLPCRPGSIRGSRKTRRVISWRPSPTISTIARRCGSAQSRAVPCGARMCRTGQLPGTAFSVRSGVNGTPTGCREGVQTPTVASLALTPLLPRTPRWLRHPQRGPWFEESVRAMHARPRRVAGTRGLRDKPAGRLRGGPNTSPGPLAGIDFEANACTPNQPSVSNCHSRGVRGRWPPNLPRCDVWPIGTRWRDRESAPPLIGAVIALAGLCVVPHTHATAGGGVDENLVGG